MKEKDSALSGDMFGSFMTKEERIAKELGEHKNKHEQDEVKKTLNDSIYRIDKELLTNPKPTAIHKQIRKALEDCLDLINKSRAYQMNTVVTRKDGNQYKKTPNGWILLPKNNSDKTKTNISTNQHGLSNKNSGDLHTIITTKKAGRERQEAIKEIIKRATKKQGHSPKTLYEAFQILDLNEPKTPKL